MTLRELEEQQIVCKAGEYDCEPELPLRDVDEFDQVDAWREDAENVLEPGGCDLRCPHLHAFVAVVGVGEGSEVVV